jgi:hypothetical protein
MRCRDRYAVAQMDWLAVRAVLRPIIEAQEGRASMRAIQEKTGIAPSTLVRWKEEVNRPVDLGKVVTALELFGESPAAFFVAVEHRASLVTDPVTGTDQGSVPHHGGIPDVPKPERAAIQREVAMLLTEITRCETRLSKARDVAGRLSALAGVRGKGKTAARRRA